MHSFCQQHKPQLPVIALIGAGRVDGPRHAALTAEFAETYEAMAAFAASPVQNRVTARTRGSG